APAAAAATAATHAEEIVEDVGESRGHVTEAAGRPRSAAVLEGRMSEAVIGCALVRVLEDFVGLVDLLETSLAALVAGIAIGMPFHRELAERRLQLGIARGAL